MTETLILRERPSVVEAKRLDENNREEIARWVKGWTYGVSGVRWLDRDHGTVVGIEVGDWAVRTAFGEYKPVKDTVIFSRYETVLPVVSE